MRLGVYMFVVGAVLGIAACGAGDAGDDDVAMPLTLEQRVVGETEAPGSEEDPRETPRTATGLEELAANMEHQLITPTEEEKAALGEAGFVSAILDTRFFPSEAGGAHVGDEPHLSTLVMQFNTNEGAADAVDLLHADGLEPCPVTCAFDLAEFEVDGIPNAKGAQRIATQEALEQTGDTELSPHAEYAIRFADGIFAYDVRLFGAPDQVSERQAEEIVARLYARIHGAPLPES